MLRFAFSIGMAFLCVSGAAGGDDGKLIPPKFSASIVCFNGKEGSRSNCRSSLAVIDDETRVTTARLICGHKGSVSEISWTYAGHKDGKDVYHVVRKFPADTDAAKSVETIVSFDGQQRILFEDQAQCILIRVESENGDAASLPAPKVAPPAIHSNGEIRGQLLSTDGKPIAGATVALGSVTKSASGPANQPADGVVVVTGEDGSYRLLAPEPVVYVVWLKKHPNLKMTAAADDGLIVQGGEITESVLRSVALRRVRGRVVDEAGKVLGDVQVSYRTVARPGFELPSQSVMTDANGSFEILAPAGWCVFHATQRIAATDDNPFGVGLQASLRIDIPAVQNSAAVFEAERLVLTAKSINLGDTSWVRLATPGTKVVRQENTGGVKGVVLSSAMRPVPGATVLRSDGVSVTANAAGEFILPADPKTQFVMSAAAPGYHLWSGTPAAGDVLKIVLEPK